MVAEGRRILRNLQRVTKLFVTKSVFAAFVIVAIGITPTEYPLLPRHLTIVGALTVGIPAFFLALAPSDGPWRTDGFLREVGRFAVPAGVAAGLGVTTTYLIAVNVFDLGLLQSRTAATTTLDRDRPLPRARARGDEHAARAARRDPLRRPPRSSTCSSSRFPARGASSSSPCPTPAAVVLILLGAGIAIGFLWLTDDRFVPLRGRAGLTAPGYDDVMAVSTTRPLDTAALRADFPFLEELVDGKPLAYLDSASSTQKPRQVLDRMRAFYEHEYANVHRGVYRLAERATEGYEARPPRRRGVRQRAGRRARSSSRAARRRRSTSSPTRGASRTSARATPS